MAKSVQTKAQARVTAPSEAEFAERLAEWVEPEPRYRRGVLANYATLVSSASQGAVTVSHYEQV